MNQICLYILSKTNSMLHSLLWGFGQEKDTSHIIPTKHIHQNIYTLFFALRSANIFSVLLLFFYCCSFALRLTTFNAVLFLFYSWFFCLEIICCLCFPFRKFPPKRIYHEIHTFAASEEFHLDHLSDSFKLIECAEMC